MAKVKYGNWDLVKELEEFEEETIKWAKKGIAKTINKIYNTAVALAPVDMGFLKESIDFMYKDGGLTGIISVGAEYAIYVEYGTGIYATGPGGSRAKNSLGLMKMKMENGTLLTVVQRNLFGTQLSMKAEHSSISIFHRGG